jgi:hypothetical protein
VGPLMSAFLIGQLGSSAFQAIHHFSVDVSRGLALLFGLGTKALPSWGSKTRWNNLLVGLAVRLTAGPSGQFRDIQSRRPETGESASGMFRPIAVRLVMSVV